jgi:hypothetical protein
MLSSIFALVVVPACLTAKGNAHAVLDRAASVVGLNTVSARILRLDGSDIVSQDYQSDRTNYPPYLSDVQPLQLWYSAASRVERRSSASSMAGFKFGGAVMIGSEHFTYVARDSTLMPSEAAHTTMHSLRPLNVWAVIGDWRDDPTVRVVERCTYRDYPRLVLSRRGVGARATERLFIDEKSGFPVKLERDETHYLWGQNRVEYVYSTWQRVGDAAFPGVSFRVVDGRTNVERNLNSISLVSPDSAPRLAVPENTREMGFAVEPFLRPVSPDTIRLGAAAFVLKNPGYAEMVVLARDTVFIFDATQGEQRAHLDSAWIGRLFPGKHPIALIVTDLAWPHIAGVRYWAALGVPIYTHRAAVSMIDSIVARHWTVDPDLLERAKKRRAPRIIPVTDTLRLAGGDLLLFAIDGVSSEVALAGFDGRDGLLWASDYIQDSRAPSMYLDEVCHALVRVHKTPERAVAEHLAVTPWPVLRPMARCDPLNG